MYGAPLRNPRLIADPGWLLVLRPQSLPTGWRLALIAKEILQQSRAFVGEYAGPDFRAVIEARVAQQVFDRAGHPGFLIPRAEHDSLHPRKDDRAGAHRARLERYVEGAVVEAPPIQFR